MRPILIPFFEKQIRSNLGKRGVDHRFLSTKAGRIHLYDVKGQGTLPTVVILHGISASGTSFAPLFMRLRPHVKRILVPDYPGHGLNEDPTVRLTLDTLFETVATALEAELGDAPVVIIGNSLGGAVALDFAVRREKSHPGSVKSVVLMSPAGAQSSEAEWSALLANFAMKNRREGLAFMQRVYHRMPMAMRLIAHELPANVRRRGVADLFGSVSSDITVPADELGKLTMPMLFLWGKSERLLPASHLGWWKQNLPKQAVVEEPYGMGHCPHVDAPGPLADRIVAFLRENVTMAVS